jgi:hypothetical protein
MKKIIYVIRTDMPLLKMLGLFGCINWKVALRKEITALFVLEVWFFLLFILYTEICRTAFSFPRWEFCVHKVARGTLEVKYSQCKSSIKMLWTKLYNTNEMKFNRRTSMFIFNYHYILLNFGTSKRVMEVKRKGSHATLDTRHRTKTYKTKNTAQKTTKISNTKPPRQKQNEKRIKPSCPWRVSSCCFLPFLFAVGFVSLNSF